MKRVWLASLLATCLGLVVATTYFDPPTAFAATGSASCGNRENATCDAYTCVCIDGSGCTGFDANGGVTSTSRCSDQPVRIFAQAPPTRPF
jgi:hypothetical protein